MKIQSRHSEILETVVCMLYPVIILFGIYIIIRGSVSPGGGFQGGAILATIFMVRYLVDADSVADTAVMKTLEKVFFIALIFLASFAIIFNMSGLSMQVRKLYLLVMNVIIGIKVCCGISIIFFKFALIESG